jgi:hypothetical protein
MKPYKLKHKPTGLYFQPISHRGSHFSKRGKIYQTKTNILNLGYYSDGSPRKEIKIEAHKDTLIYKEFKDKLVWIEPSRRSDKYTTITFSDDWEIEEI